MSLYKAGETISISRGDGKILDVYVSDNTGDIVYEVLDLDTDEYPLIREDDIPLQEPTK